MDIGQQLHDEIAEHIAVVERTRDSTSAVFEQVVNVCSKAVQAGNRLLFFGNGGSAADAQHLATELVVRYRINRPAIGAIALTTDTSALTAIGNDFGFEDLFARQIDALCRSGDVAIGISTSGNSENVIRGVLAAKARGAVTVGLCGGDGGRMVEHVDYAIVVPSKTTARIQEMHILLGHTLCGLLEERCRCQC